MSKTNHKPKREQIKKQRKQYKKVQKELRQDEKAKGLHAHSHSTISNHKCGYESVEQESLTRNNAVAEKIRIFRAKLPVLLRQLSKIEDPRNPKKTKHKLSSLMI